MCETPQGPVSKRTAKEDTRTAKRYSPAGNRTRGASDRNDKLECYLYLWIHQLGVQALFERAKIYTTEEGWRFYLHV